MARFKEQSPSHQNTTMKSASILNQVGKVTRIIFIGGMIFLVIINAQPWIELARKIVPTITTIPFLSSLIKIPFLGGWVQWAVKEMVSILGLLLCGTIQIIEIMPMLYPNNPALKNLRAIAYAIEFLVCFLRFPPYAGGVSAFWDDFGRWDSYLIDWWNLAFFIITMTGFEVAVKVGIIILQSLSSPKTERP
jgi:hypothetical protein